MADELSSETTVDKTMFISSLNPDTPSFEPTSSSSYQHIVETEQRRNSNDENNNNHSHIEPIQNGDHQQTDETNASSTIHSVELTEHSPSKTHYIEETTEVDQNGTDDPTFPSHIQPVITSDAEVLKEEPTEEEEEEEEEELDLPFEQEELNEAPFEQSTFEASTLNNEPESTTSLVEDEILNIEQPPFDFQKMENDKPDELKAQRELDEDEIPPVEVERVPTPETVSTIEIPQNVEIVIDEPIESRPLTALETPFEHHDNDENRINESSSSLPDVVTQTLEQDRGDFAQQPNLLDQPLLNESPLKDEVLPPLTPSSLALEQTLDSQSPTLKEEELPLLNSVPPLVEPDDILGNKSLLKQTIVPGKSDTRPTRSTIATVSYILSLVEQPSGNSRVIESISNETFFIGESDILPAIDLSVQMMNRGERSLIDSDVRHCYGELGCEDKQIPPISRGTYRMKIDLELNDWQVAPDVQTLSIDERLKWGDRKRHMGNFHYRRQDYSTALTCYRGALRFLDIDDNPILNDNDSSILNDRYVQVQNNVGQVNLLLLRYEPCLEAVKNVLKRDPRNVKALFRQGKALFELGKYDEARMSFKLFNQHDMSSTASGSDKSKVMEMLNICETKLAGYQKNEKEIYRRMFQPTTTTTTSGATSSSKTGTKSNPITDTKSNNWLTYVSLGAAVLAAAGLAAFLKYRKTT